MLWRILIFGSRMNPQDGKGCGVFPGYIICRCWWWDSKVVPSWGFPIWVCILFLVLWVCGCIERGRSQILQGVWCHSHDHSISSWWSGQWNLCRSPPGWCQPWWLWLCTPHCSPGSQYQASPCRSPFFSGANNCNHKAPPGLLLHFHHWDLKFYYCVLKFAFSCWACTYNLFWCNFCCKFCAICV